MNNNLASDFIEWEQHLTPQLLPVDPVVKHQALENLNSRSANAKKVALILTQDPTLCLLLFHHANQSLSASGNESFELSHTISLLGFPRVEALISNSIEQDGNFPYIDEYRQQLSISVHAAHQADGWADKNPHWPQTALYWATLFHYSPIWAMWCQAGDKMARLQQVQANYRGATQPHLEQALFGTHLSVLCASLSKQWHLPSLSQQSWQHTQNNNAKLWVQLSRIKQPQTNARTPSVQRLCSSPAFAITLANRLAAEAEWDWMSTRCLRLQKILASSLHYSVNQAISLTHQQAVNASSFQAIPNALPCAIQLLSHYIKAEHYRTTKADSGEKNITPKTGSLKTKPSVAQQTKPLPVKTATEHHLSEFDNALKQLMEQPTTFTNLHDVMNLAVITLCKNTDLERATISLLNIQNKQIRTSYSAGCKNTPALKHFSHTLQRGDLFNKLLQKPGSLRIGKSNREKIWPLLPDKFQQACAANEFFMMSLFADKRPVALLYADSAISHTALNDKNYKQFKRLSQAVCQCLASLHSRK